MMIFKDHLILGAFAFRVLVLVWVLATGHWHGADTESYLAYSSSVCGPDWLGLASKPPFYYWFVCLLVPGVDPSVSTLQVALPLIIQAVVSWFVGLWLYRESRSKMIAALWFFDPVIVVYTSFLMMDGLFASLALASGLMFLKVIRSRSGGEVALRDAVILGVLLAVLALFRSNGFLVPLFMLPTLVMVTLLWQLRWKTVFTVMATLALLLTPRLAWNYDRYNFIGLSDQSSGWIHTVAAVVKYHDQGLDFLTSERKWFQENPSATKDTVADALKEKPLTSALLISKGILRTLIGHVNVEWGYLLTGVAVVGPGWSRPPEPREGPRIQAWLFVPWILGILVTLSITCFTYLNAAKHALKVRRVDYILLLCFALVAVYAVSPLVFGDARFRTGLWPWILLALVRGQKLRGDQLSSGIAS